MINAVWNAERVLPSMSLPFPAFLKIDVDTLWLCKLLFVRYNVLCQLAKHQNTTSEILINFQFQDNGDCDFLESWLSSGYRPLFVEMELIHSFVPPEIEVGNHSLMLHIGICRYRHI